MPMFIISIFEPLEYFDSYQKFLRNPDGTMSTDRKVLVRSIGTMFIVAICFISDKVSEVTQFKGNFLCPLVSFVVPIIMVHSKATFIDNKRKSCWRILHDLVILGISFFMMINGTYNQMYKFMYEKET